MDENPYAATQQPPVAPVETKGRWPTYAVIASLAMLLLVLVLSGLGLVVYLAEKYIHHDPN